jgi:hypothetical protein
VFLALRPLIDLREVASSHAPSRLVREPGFWLAIVLLATSERLVDAVAILPARIGAERFLMDTLYTSTPQPGGFFLAHVLYFGPVLLFLLPLWPEVSRSARQHGTGLVACFALAAVLSVGSESRKLINFLPFVVLSLAGLSRRGSRSDGSSHSPSCAFSSPRSGCRWIGRSKSRSLAR